MQMTRAGLLKVLRVAVGFLQDNVDVEISAQRIITLIGVAEHLGVAQYELGERIGIDRCASRGAASSESGIRTAGLSILRGNKAAATKTTTGWAFRRSLRRSAFGWRGPH